MSKTTLDTGKPIASTILVIDDEADYRVMLTHFLKTEGHNAMAAEDITSGMEAVEKFSPDVILLDWNMPNGDGINMVKRLRAAPKHREIYVIMVTARSEPEEKIAGLEAGADDYLTKPYHQSELLARVRVGLRTRCLQRELAEQIQLNTVLQMAGAMAHEIGNPLTSALLIHHQLLKIPALANDPELARTIENLGSELDRIETLVRQAQSIKSVHSIPYADTLRIIDLKHPR